MYLMSLPFRPIFGYLPIFLITFVIGAGTVSAGEGKPGLGVVSPGMPGVGLARPPAPVQGDEELSTASRWWTRLYGAGFYDTRWNGWFLQSYLQQGYDLVPDRRLSFYGIAWLTGDSRSSGAGPAPAIISDNLLLLGAGLRYRPVRWLWFDAQQGVAFDLVERNGAKATRGDFRFSATGGAGIYPDFLVHDHLASPLTPMADFFLSSGYYSRYKNVITYAQGRLGVRVTEVSRSFMDVYLRGDVAFDSEGAFYNNLLEIGPGLRFTPNPDWGLFLLVEYRRGYYADYTDAMKQVRAAFYPAQYDAVRFFLVLDREF